MIPLGCVLALGVAASYIRQRLMVSVGQGTMLKIRTDLFTHMESLPIRYFDTHSHGDIMSIYTNDVDTLRQLISQSIPEVINSAISVVMVFFAMLNNSWIMTILLAHPADVPDAGVRQTRETVRQALCRAAGEFGPRQRLH